MGRARDPEWTLGECRRSAVDDLADHAEETDDAPRIVSTTYSDVAGGPGQPVFMGGTKGLSRKLTERPIPDVVV